MRSIYQEQFLNFKNSLFENPNPKYLFGHPIDGQTLGKILVKFVEEINKGSIPNISNAWESLIENKIIEFYELSRAIFENKIKQLENRELIENFNLVIDEIKNSTLTNYEKVKKYINFNDESNLYTILYKKYKTLLENEIIKKTNKMKIKSEEDSQNFCRQLFTELSNNLNLKIVNKEFKLENISELNAEIRHIILSYTEKAKGFAKTKIFIEEVVNLENKIIIYLQKLHEEEKAKTILQIKIKSVEKETENIVNLKNITEKSKPSLYRNPEDEYEEENVLEHPLHNQYSQNHSGSESEEDKEKSSKIVKNDKFENMDNKKNVKNVKNISKTSSNDKEKVKEKSKHKNKDKSKDKDKDKKEKKNKNEKKSHMKYTKENTPDDACGCNLF